MVLPSYVTREVVKAATDQLETARSNARVDRAIASASRTVEGELHRPNLYPLAATRTFDWPPSQQSPPWVLDLEEHELISVTTLVAGGVTIPSIDYLLRPDDGPPYDRVEIDLSTSSAFAAGDTHQRAVSITGVWGYRDDEVTAGALAEALDDSEVLVDVTDSAAVGVGSLIRVDAERMIVTGKTMLTTGQTGSLTISNADKTLAVANGAAFAVGETLLMGAERLLVEDIAGNTLVVTRAYDGSTLAAHTTATIYAPRTLTVERGAAGTTAATHSSGATIYRWEPPGPVESLALAHAVCELQQQSAGYARTAGSGDNERETAGRGLAAARVNARRYKRKGRTWAV